MIELRIPPAHLAITELIQGARQETAQFQHRQATDNCCVYELFRRAILLRDDLAWSGLYELYNPVVSSWILSQVPKPVGEDLEVLVNDAFARFAHATPQKWSSFTCVPTLLGYLKCCAKSAATDYRRWRLPRQDVDLESLSQSQEPLSDDCAESVIERLAAQELWRIVSGDAPAQEERLILLLICAQGMSPRALQCRYPTLFPTVQDIYRIKRNVLERLQRNKELRQLLHSQWGEVLP